MRTSEDKISKRDRKTNFIALNLYIFFIAIYLLTAAGLNFYHTDTSVMRLQVAQSIIENADPSVPEGIRGTDGKAYSWFGIGSALLAIPFYIFGKLIGIPAVAVSLMNQFFGAATTVLVFLFSISLGYSRRASLLVSIFYGLGTIAWPLAKHPFDNTVETFFILFSIYCMYHFVSDRKILNLLLSAFLVGFAFITRQSSILVVPPLLIMMALNSIKGFDKSRIMKLIIRDSVFFSIVFLPFLALSFWYNYYRFGSIFETGYQLIAMRAGINLFTGTSFFTGLSGFLVSPGKGFFYYSPVAILFFFSIKSFMKRHSGLGISFILIIISYILLFSTYFFWHGDWAWGPRYFLVLTPLLIIPIAGLIDSDIWKKKRVARVVIYSIFTFSLAIQIAAVSVDFKKYFVNLQIEEKTKFTGTYIDEVLPTFQPPAETYFNVRNSPILAQFKFIYEISKEIKDYRYSELPDDAKRSEKIKASPYMNVYDFWWLYNYFSDRTYSGFFTALVLLLLATYTAIRLWKTVTKNDLN